MCYKNISALNKNRTLKRRRIEIKKVLKYTVPIGISFSLELPKGAEISTVWEQCGKPQIWFVADTENPKETRNFRLILTGHPIKYIGSFELEKGSFLGHLFEIKK